MGDATELATSNTAEQVVGVGVPPAKELFQKLLDNRVPVSVGKGCAVVRGATDEDLEWPGDVETPRELARMIADYDRVISM